MELDGVEWYYNIPKEANPWILESEAFEARCGSDGPNPGEKWIFKITVS